MNNLINLFNLLNINPAYDKLPAVQITEITPEMLTAIKNNQTAMLEVLFNADSTPKYNLKIGEQTFAIDIKSSLIGKLPQGQDVSIPVKVTANGKLYIQNNPENVHQTDASYKSPIKAPLPKAQETPAVTIDGKGFHQKIISTPIKLDSFVQKTLADIPIPEPVKQQIIDILGSLKAEITKTGAENYPKTQEYISNLQNTIKQAASNPQNPNNIKQDLEAAVNKLIGQSIKGEVSERFNDLTGVKTDIGTTFFFSKIKLPLSEKVDVNIIDKMPKYENEIKVLDTILKIINSKEEKSAPDIEKIIKSEFFKPLQKLNADVPPEIFNVIINKLPLQSDNLLEKIFNFYQAATKQDITLMLGRETVKNIVESDKNSKQVISELTNFVANSTKETPSWRIVEMPLFDGNQMNLLKIATKKDSRKNPKQKKESGTRFVVETEFSKLGSFQFDGFSNIEKRNFDLIIRTSSDLAEDFCTNIINLFKKTLYTLNYSGTIKINRQENFINLQDTETPNEGIYI